MWAVLQQGPESCAPGFLCRRQRGTEAQTQESGSPADLEGRPSSTTEQLHRLELIASSQPRFPHLYNGGNGACLRG